MELGNILKKRNRNKFERWKGKSKDNRKKMRIRLWDEKM